ncbi:hypothetical protein [Mucilaginibacter gotjawali]|uniref:Abi (CAAX) family protease n=1 Tax=Mucilaginibacter gotjawali TaxID=1550579 RepID=A0A839S9D2_9SPHI|nr:hypothetical protein [Mucilaginibacter gotjawali]MBB3054436.1 putative Abi (CAAX) family protease [Mucilaginibacter gotjawali]
MNKVSFALVYYFIAFSLIIISHKIDPTNLAGPGLDFFVYPIILICSVVFLVKALFKAQRRAAAWMPFVIHFLGVIILVGILFL